MGLIQALVHRVITSRDHGPIERLSIEEKYFISCCEDKFDLLAHQLQDVFVHSYSNILHVCWLPETELNRLVLDEL